MEDRKTLKKIRLKDLPIDKEVVEHLDLLHIKTLFDLILSDAITDDERKRLKSSDKRINQIFKEKDNYIKNAALQRELDILISGISITNLPISKKTLIFLKKNDILTIGKLIKNQFYLDQLCKTTRNQYLDEIKEELLKTISFLQSNKLYFLSEEFKRTKKLNSYSDEMMLKWLEVEGSDCKLKDFYLSDEIFDKISALSVEKLPIPTIWTMKLVAHKIITIGDLFNIDAFEFKYISDLPQTAINNLNKIFLAISNQGMNYFFSDEYRANKNLMDSSEQEILSWLYSDLYNPDLKSGRLTMKLWAALKEKAKCEKIDSSIKKNEYYQFLSEKIKNRYDELKDIPIEDLYLSKIDDIKLIDKKINSVGQLFDYVLSNLSNGKLGFFSNSKILKTIISLTEKGIQYVEEKEKEEERKCIDKWTRRVARAKRNKKGFDYKTIEIIENLFEVSVIRYCKWTNLSHTGISNAISTKSELYGDTWTAKELTDTDIKNINKFIIYKTMNYKDKDVTGIFINKKNNLDKSEKDFVCLLEYEDEVKCFFSNEISEELKNKFWNEGFHWKNQLEISGCCDGEILTVFKKPYFFPKDSKYFARHAASRGMTVDEYSIFLTGFEYSRARKTDKDFIKVIEEYSKNGKVYFPMNRELAWLRSFISRNGYSVKEFVELFGYQYRY